MIRGLFLAALLALPMLAHAEEDEDPAWDRKGYERVKNVFLKRPMITPVRTFEVFVVPSLSGPYRTLHSFLNLPREERRTDPTFGVRTGAKYGFSEDIEVAVVLPPMIFIDGLQFTGPVLEGTWLAISTGGFELGLTASSVLPVQNGFAFEARVPVQITFGETLRLSAEPRITGILGDRREYGTAGLPIALTAQLAPELYVRLSTGVSTLAFEDLYVMAGASIGYTIHGDYGAFGDIGLGVSFPTLIEARGFGTEVVTDHWIIELSGRFFVRLVQDRGDKHHDDEEL